VNKLSDILQLESLGKTRNIKDYKTAFTAEAVRRIHEAVMEAWPPDSDILSILQRISTDVSGLYIGDYDLEYISRGIIRHSIYANKILIVDPFVYPRSVRDEYNPVLQPEQYRAQTLKNVNFWFALLPWVEAGIVEMIRTPADFDRKLNWDSLVLQHKKYEENEVLKRAADVSVQDFMKRHLKKQAHQFLLLGAPDSYIRRTFEELNLEQKDKGFTVDLFLKHVQTMREEDPNFLEAVRGKSQLHMMTTGTSYDIAKLTASITHSYLVTDVYVKWREIELDRENQNVENRTWAPLAKAIQNANLKYLNELRLDHALILRKEGRLESLRTFLRKVWKEACIERPFDEANAQLLADELQEKIHEAEEEWKKIDQDLLKIIGGELSAGLLAAGPLIASGHGDFVAAAAVIAGATNLTLSTVQRRRFPNRFPAAFFMRVAGDV
jgi:hypothetical protein